MVALFYSSGTNSGTNQHFFLFLILCTFANVFNSMGWSASPRGLRTGQTRDGLAPITQTARPLKHKKMTEELKQVADLITANIINTTKEVLTSNEAAKYMGISKSYLYKLTMGQKIPHYKPLGKMVYFKRVELESWLQSNRVATGNEITQKALTFCVKKGGTK